MDKESVNEIIELAKKLNKKDYEQFLILKGYMLGILNKKKVQ